jgi:hypothetical protein
MVGELIMADKNIAKFTVRFWDYWVDDPIDRGSNPMILNMIYEIENTRKLYFIQKELNDDN